MNDFIKDNLQTTLQPLFIIGCYRSGTTLLRRILNTHTKIHISKETNFLIHIDLEFFNKEILSNRELLEIFQYVTESLKKERWEKIPTYTDFVNICSEKTLSQLYKFVCLFEKPINKSSLLYWGDNTPRYVYIIPLLLENFPNAHFIHIVRDPRDVVASVRQLNFGGYTPFVIAMEWLERVSLALLVKEFVGLENYLLIRFEDLILRWEETVSKISKFLNVENSFSCLPCDEDSSILASSLPHHKNLAKPLDKNMIGKYQKFLSRHEIEVIESLTYSFLKVFNYEVSKATISPTCLELYYNIGMEYIKNWLIRLKKKIKNLLYNY